MTKHSISPYPNSRFHRDSLPQPATYHSRQGRKLIGRGEWRSAICPFHPDKHPSLRINIRTGGYRCMVCDAKGGDVLDFHRQRYGMDFVEACRDLGAWTEAR